MSDSDYDIKILVKREADTFEIQFRDKEDLDLFMQLSKYRSGGEPNVVVSVDKEGKSVWTTYGEKGMFRDLRYLTANRKSLVFTAKLYSDRVENKEKKKP